MNEFEIRRILRTHPHTKNEFRGVFAANELPPLILPHGVYIVNLSGRDMLGSHWVTLYVNRYNIGHYLDSGGRPPFVPSIIDALLSLDYIVYNSIALQSEDSVSCGLFAVMFAVFFARGLGIYQIRLFFNREPHLLALNEHIVAALVSKELLTFGAPWSSELAREIRRWKGPS